MGNEQSTALSPSGSKVPDASTSLTKEEKVANFAEELERKRLENVARKRAQREEAERDAVKKNSRAETLAKDQQAAEKYRLEKQTQRAPKPDERPSTTTPGTEQEKTKAALQARMGVLQRELAGQHQRPKPVGGGSVPTGPASSRSAAMSPLGQIMDGRGESAPGLARDAPIARGGAISEQRGPRSMVRDDIASNSASATKARLGRELDGGSERVSSTEAARGALGATPNTTSRPSATTPRGPAADKAAGATLPSRQRRDTPPRRESNDSGIGMARAVEDNTRAIKVPTGPCRVPRNDERNRAIAPPTKDSSSAKRPAPPEAEDTPKRPKTGPSSASPRSPPGSAQNTADLKPPAWYTALSFVPKRGQEDAAVEPFLKTLKTKIAFCKDPKNFSNLAQIQHKFNEIRRSIHELMFQTVNEKLLRNNSMLHNDRGLPQLFDERYSGGVDWPFDIKADAKELYYKWCNRVWETDLLRGIIPGGGKSNSNDRSSDKLDEKWPYRVSPKFHGNGQLVNGQWWPTQLAALRDGGHGSSQAGIYGEPGKGAYSCIMAGNPEYAHKDDGDKDEGDIVYYCGTDSFDGNITTPTKHMIESCNNATHPVRLIRSHKVLSKYAPEMGLRYDGLYDVVSFERLDPEDSLRQRHRFMLVRRGGQDPIRGGWGPEKRPTGQELEAYQRDKRLRGVGGSGGGGGKGKKGTVFNTWG